MIDVQHISRAYGGFLAVDNVRIESVPEPAMLALLGFGLAFIGYRVHRSNRAA